MYFSTPLHMKCSTFMLRIGWLVAQTVSPFTINCRITRFEPQLNHSNIWPSGGRQICLWVPCSSGPGLVTVQHRQDLESRSSTGWNSSLRFCTKSPQLDLKAWVETLDPKSSGCGKLKFRISQFLPSFCIKGGHLNAWMWTYLNSRAACKVSAAGKDGACALITWTTLCARLEVVEKKNPCNCLHLIYLPYP